MVLSSLKMNEKHTNLNSKLAAKLYQLQGNIIKLSTPRAKNNPIRIISSALHFTMKKNSFFHQDGQKAWHGGGTSVGNLTQIVFPSLYCFPRVSSVFITVGYASDT